ncbi:MAG TPA: hypothetical protein VEA41_03225 [Salinarimonas sp.]|nr:hypothetical protein [Salinarimonas sp.]
MGARHARRVLLAAYNGINALVVADELEAAGYEVVGPFVTVTKTLAALDAEPPDVAVIDAILADGPSLAVASELGGRRIPFVVHTGWPRSGRLRSDYADAPWLECPCPASQVVDAVAALVPVSRADPGPSARP